MNRSSAPFVDRVTDVLENAGDELDELSECLFTGKSKMSSGRLIPALKPRYKALTATAIWRRGCVKCCTVSIGLEAQPYC
jgi:hypothetical protein